MFQKADNLESIMWQLYGANFRPNIQYGAGKLTWVSLTLNKHTFNVKSQQLIEWAMTERWRCNTPRSSTRCTAQDGVPLPTLQVRAQELLRRARSGDIGKCRTVTNVGWLSKLVGVSLNQHRRPPIIEKSNLA